MSFTRNGQRPVDPVVTGLTAAGLEQSFLIDQGVIPRVDVKGNISGTWMAANPRTAANITGKNLVRARGADRNVSHRLDPFNGTFNCKFYSDSTPQDMQQDHIIDQLTEDVDVATEVANRIKLEAETRLRDLLFNTSNWVDYTCAGIPNGGSTQWDQAGATPLVDLSAIMRLFHLQSWGRRLNTVLLSYDVASVLSANEEVRGYAPNAFGAAAGVGSRVLSTANDFSGLKTVIAQVMGIPAHRVFVGGAVQDTSNIGQSSATKAAVWSDQIWLAHVDPKQRFAGKEGAKAKLGPTAAVDFCAYDFRAGAFDVPGGIHRISYAEQANDFVAVDAEQAILITDVLL